MKKIILKAIIIGLLVLPSAGFTEEIQTKNAELTTADSKKVENPNPAADIRDPYENTNRKIFEFNQKIDKGIVQPVAKTYKAVVPELFRNMASSFFSNIGDMVAVVNDVLQLKPKQAFKDASRVVINSTFGFYGIVDWATAMGIEKNQAGGFGDTLSRWGFGSGSYLMLPVLGPSTTGDAIGVIVDMQLDPVGHVNHISTRNSASITRMIDKRSNLLDATDILEKAALDPYEAYKDAYFQRREKRLKYLENN